MHYQRYIKEFQNSNLARTHFLTNYDEVSNPTLFTLRNWVNIIPWLAYLPMGNSSWPTLGTTIQKNNYGYVKILSGIEHLEFTNNDLNSKESECTPGGGALTYKGDGIQLPTYGLSVIDFLSKRGH